MFNLYASPDKPGYTGPPSRIIREASMAKAAPGYYVVDVKDGFHVVNGPVADLKAAFMDALTRYQVEGGCFEVFDGDGFNVTSEGRWAYLGTGPTSEPRPEN